MVSFAASQQESPEFESTDLSVWSLYVLSVLVFSGNSKLAVGVNDCLSFWVSPAVNWQLVTAGWAPAPPVTLNRVKKKKMDRFRFPTSKERL